VLGKAGATLARIVALATLAGAGPSLAAEPFETAAPRAILVEYETGATLFEKSPDLQFGAGSFAKLMTAAVVFQAVKDGRLDLDDSFVISDDAWRRGGAPSGGSSMFAVLGSAVPVSDLLRGLVVAGANDAAIALAEGIAGSETAFAELMNNEAQRIGLKQSHFTNSTGLPDGGQHTTARDLAILASGLVRTYPDLYRIFAEREFTWNKIRQQSRVPLLATTAGVDGLNSSFLKDAGYGMVASAERDGRRLVAVISGAGSLEARAEEGRRLIEFGFGQPRAEAIAAVVPEPEAVGSEQTPTPTAEAEVAAKAPDPNLKTGASASLETRIALVIGNATYAAVGKLPNPPNDAEAVAEALRESGFSNVTLVHDAARADLVAALNGFADKAASADWAVVYFAGHGIELDGANYLIPIDARLRADRDVQDEAVSLDRVMVAVQPARKLRLVILDACRNNPFIADMRVTVASRAIHRGLARVEPDGGTLVAYAAKGGQEAIDGDETGNSPFAAALVKRLRTPGLEIGKLFRLVRDDVLAATDRRQEPFVYGSLPGEDFFFRTN
jgi:D-alanyl-D-alanine carboxypeptidase